MDTATLLQSFRTGVSGRSQLWDAGDWRRRPERSSWRIDIKDTWRHIDSYTYNRIVCDSQRLFANLGVVKGAALEKADYAVGEAWNPVFLGRDRKWGERAAEMLREWHMTCNILGAPFNWQKSLALASLCVDRDGRSFVRLFRTDSGYPLIQFIPGHRVKSSQPGEIIRGEFTGNVSTNGVIMTPYGRAIAFEIAPQKPDQKPAFVLASRMIQIFDPEWWDSGTGLPSVSHAVLDLHDLKDSQDWEKLALKANSAHSLLEYNETGEREDDGNELVESTAADGSTFHYETLMGGMIRYFRANSGSKIETHTYNRPPEEWHRFIDHILRSCFSGMRWPLEIAWNPEKVGGATVRLVRNKAVRSVKCRQSVLAPPARRIDAFAIAAFIDMGELDANPEWYRWGHTLPPQITVDEGKDAQAFERLYNLGAQNLEDWLGPQGKDIEEHLRQRARAWKLKQLIAKAEDVPMEAFERATNGQAAGGPTQGKDPKEKEEDDDESDDTDE